MSINLQIIIALCLVLLLFSAFFSASETALFSIPRERLVFFQQAKSRRRRWVYELILHGQRTLLMILLGNLFVNITLTGLIYAFMRIVLPGSSTLSTMVAASGIIVIFGEMLPKNIALKHNESVACLIAPAMSGLTFVCQPVLFLLYRINGFFLNRLRIRLRRPSPFVTVDEMKSGVIASRARGAISIKEQDIIVRLLDRGTQPVKNFMIHRSSLLLMPQDGLCQEALKRMHEEHKSIVFIYNRDNSAQVVGMAHVGTLMRCEPLLHLCDAARPVQWISSAMEVAEAIRLLIDKSVSEAAIIDEFGSFCGVFSLSTALRGVMTPLFDPQLTKDVAAEGRTKIFNGETTVESMTGWLPPSLQRGAHKARTLNGLVTGYLGYIPRAGEKFAIDGWMFYIISADPTRLGSILIKKKEKI